MSKRSPPTPRPEAERPALAQSWRPTKEDLLLIAALAVALALSGRGDISATGDVIVIEQLSLPTL
jgi:hypothetical protein